MRIAVSFSRWFQLWPALILTYFLTSTSSFASDFQSPRAAGLGGAGHAAPWLNDSIYLNPSFTSFHPFRGVSTNYLWHGSDDLDAAGQSVSKGTLWNFSIFDGSSDNAFQAGLGFTKRGDGAFLHIGASKSIINRLGVGLGTKIFFPGGSSDRYFDTTLSFSGIATDWFQASFMVDNLFETSPNYGLYRQYILGTKFNLLSILSIHVDPHLVPSLPSGQTWGYEAGLELTLLSDFYLRFGNFRNSQIPFQASWGNGYGFGLGWLGPKISVDYGITRVLYPKNATAHQIGLTIFF